MNLDSISLGDIPDLSTINSHTETEPFSDGWYAGTILERRTFTDQNGNDRVFESSDTPSQNGDSRNIRLQVQVKRASDGRTLNTNIQVNYRPEDLTAETIQAVAKRQEESKDNGNQMGDLFRPFMTLTRLASLQKIAGVRQFQRNGNGGLDLTPVYGKTAYFRLGDDPRSGGKYKEVKTFQADAPKRAKVQ